MSFYVSPPRGVGHWIPTLFSAACWVLCRNLEGQVTWLRGGTCVCKNGNRRCPLKTCATMECIPAGRGSFPFAARACEPLTTSSCQLCLPRHLNLDRSLFGMLLLHDLTPLFYLFAFKQQVQTFTGRGAPASSWRLASLSACPHQLFPSVLPCEHVSPISQFGQGPGEARVSCKSHF